MVNEHTAKGQHILVIERDDATRSACIDVATRRGFIAEGLAEMMDPRELLRGRRIDLLLMQLTTDEASLEFLEEIRTRKPDTPILVMTSASNLQFAVEAMRIGATDYLVKPFGIERLEAALDEAIQHKQVEWDLGLEGHNPEMEKLHRMLPNLAESQHPALIVGESGTGKETMARTIHTQSKFSSEPFLSVHCDAPPDLIYRQLFGCATSASPDELSNVPGVLAAAGRGTVFLDEIGHLSAELQSKLISVLEEKAIRASGTDQAVAIHSRVLAASSVDLSTAVMKGIFRKDLYTHLNVVTLRIPPLRERRTDIRLLAEHFLERRSLESGINYTLSEDALRSMMTYDWPNNIRELENTIERACTMATGSVIYIGDLPTQQQNRELTRRREAFSRRVRPAVTAQPAMELLLIPLADLEKQAILSTVMQLNGDKLLAAQMLGIGKTTLYRKLKEYGFDDPLPMRA